MKRLLSVLFVPFGLTLSLCAQTVTNVVAKQLGNTVEITYDLNEDAIVSLHLSRDGGITYAAIPKSLTGDIGNTTAGHKKIVWNLLSDGVDWDIERARFKVVVKIDEELKFSVNGVSFKMIAVEGGTFTMGCTSEQGDDCFDDEKPTHQVTLSNFYIGQTEVTQGLWKAVMGSNPAYFRNGDNFPVEKVSWVDCKTFINKLNSLLSSQLEGKRFALPTEAQWEYAARGGQKTNGYKYSGGNTLKNVAWYGENSGNSTHYVGTKNANELGIYDMSGNVWEWCQDGYSSYSSSPQKNPLCTASGIGPVLRGGCWSGDVWGVSARFYNEPGNRDSGFGLRLVCQ